MLRGVEKFESGSHDGEGIQVCFSRREALEPCAEAGPESSGAKVTAAKGSF